MESLPIDMLINIFILLDVESFRAVRQTSKLLLGAANACVVGLHVCGLQSLNASNPLKLFPLLDCITVKLEDLRGVLDFNAFAWNRVPTVMTQSPAWLLLLQRLTIDPCPFESMDDMALESVQRGLHMAFNLTSLNLHHGSVPVALVESGTSIIELDVSYSWIKDPHRGLMTPLSCLRRVTLGGYGSQEYTLEWTEFLVSRRDHASRARGG